MIPTVTVIGLNVAGLLAGAVLTETTFGLNGMGSLLVEAIGLVDYWLINAVVFIVTIIFVMATLITDLLYAILDPRIRF
ncbi:MAG: ABC transporter permease subunit [Candidatus Hermodarchaeota archaeon]|jgi:peptide/nickel transport system permease protein